MKAGILTYHKTANYGACLQCVALTKVLDQLGIENETIDYTCKKIVQRESRISVFSGGLIKVPLYLVLALMRKRKYNLINKFTRKNGKISQKKYTRNTISECNRLYDVFISGSDIIWELNVNGEDYTYYLDFVDDDNKKYSFSSSFGYDEIPQKYYEKTKNLLSKYRLISTRENQGANIIFKCINKKVPITLDPTLLLRKDNWVTMEESFVIKHKYIFLYFDDSDHIALNFALSLSQRTGYKVVFLTDSLRPINNISIIRNISVGQFLFLIHYSEYVVTGSYHGVLFSINYNRPFFYYNRMHQSRIKTIIDNLGIKDRDIFLDKEIANKAIEWNSVNALLEKRRNQSIDYLRKIVSQSSSNDIYDDFSFN